MNRRTVRPWNIVPSRAEPTPKALPAPRYNGLMKKIFFLLILVLIGLAVFKYLNDESY